MLASLDVNHFNIKVFDMDEVLRNPVLLDTVRKLTLSPSSGMNTALNHFQFYMAERPIQAKAIIAYYGVDSEPIGWALYSTDPATDQCRYNPEPGICFQIYVLPRFRKRGVGSKLFKKATELAGSTTIKVYYSDAPVFFSKNKEYSNHKITDIYEP